MTRTEYLWDLGRIEGRVSALQAHLPGDLDPAAAAKIRDELLSMRADLDRVARVFQRLELEAAANEAENPA